VDRAELGECMRRAVTIDEPLRFVASSGSEEEVMFMIVVYRKTRLFGRPEWRWRAVARNGEVIANSTEGYVHRGDLDDILEELKLGFANAPVSEVIS
jgi:uncharacterized protein YegP (UPF0339 family)